MCLCIIKFSGTLIKLPVGRKLYKDQNNDKTFLYSAQQLHVHSLELQMIIDLLKEIDEPHH